MPRCTLLYEGAIPAVIVGGCSCATSAPPSSRLWPCRCRPSRPSSACTPGLLSINVVTLLALSLVIGVLVDDAIVEVENIERHIRMGKTPYQAAMEADEIGPGRGRHHLHPDRGLPAHGLMAGIPASSSSNLA